MTGYPVFMEWLKKQSPITWHYVATDWGEWDGDNTPIEWIIDQPNCERATALDILKCSAPAELIHYPTEPDLLKDFGRKNTPFLRSFRQIRRIIRNWNNGYYRTSTIEQQRGLGLYLKELQDSIPRCRRGFTFTEDMFDDSNGPILTASERIERRRIEMDRMNKELAALGLTKYSNGSLLIE